ncbi:hypothetical protein V8V91_00270 [Algoriphagus halophilus]|uniref:hypothetical protein n=1 Tax=Algoriphagus halophilus TaxID=226505 RepID=UPI00358EC408
MSKFKLMVKCKTALLILAAALFQNCDSPSESMDEAREKAPIQIVTLDPGISMRA